MTLLASDNLQTGVQFNTYDKYDNDYEGSNLKGVIDRLYADRFSTGEKAAVKNRTLEVGEFANSRPYSTGVSGTATSGYLWPLSTEEALSLLTTESDFLLQASDYWWLRSPGILDYCAAFVTRDGFVEYLGFDVNDDYGVRPAFNLNLKSVLFTSAAEGGKSSGAEGAGALTEVSANSTNEWKLTLLDDGTITGLDDHKDFVIKSAGITADPAAGTVTVPYSGAVTGDNEYISAIIKDSNDTIKYYGRIAKAFGAEDAAVTISTANMEEGDTLCVFNEQYNGDKTSDSSPQTDYSSALQEVTIPQLISYDVTFKVVNGSWNDGTTADKTVTLSRYDNEDKALVLQSGDIPAVGDKPNKNYKAGNWDVTPSKETAITGDTTYTYTYDKANTPVYYSVTFVDGQGKTLKTQKVESGKAATAPAAPKRSGYTFTGWDKDFSKVTANMTVTAKWKKNPAPVKKVSGTLLTKMTSKGSKNLVISWSKVSGADGYDIFFSMCNHHGKEVQLRKAGTIKGNKTFKWTKSDLKKKTAYKAIVKAYVMKNGEKSYVRTSPMVHAYTSGWTKNYTNPKSVTVKKTSVSIKTGKTYKIKADVTKLKNGKKLMPSGHAPKLRYLSSNKKIATVSSSGQIRAKAKGSCKIYVYAVNGVSKTIKLTVR